MKSRNLIAMMMTLLTPMMLFAQSVTGTVTSEAGDPLANANIVVVGTDLGTVTDETGTFILDLGAGDYTITATVIGYEPQSLIVKVNEADTDLMAAFILPLLSLLYGIERTGKFRKIKGLVLTPTRELAQQIGEVTKPFSSATNLKSCVIGLFADPDRLSDIRRNRVALMQESRSSSYTDISSIKKEVEDSKSLFKKDNWPTIDVTRKSVEETAASIIKIIEIKKNK